jgi:HAD superfamily hydrolase (TIGR01509 family)
MMLKAVLFDHDGTLVDSEEVHFQIWRSVLQPHGIVMTAEEYKLRHSGIPTPANASDLVSRHRLSLAASELADAKNLATIEYLSRTAFPLMPGAKEAVSFFHNAGLKLAVVTGAGRNGVDATVNAYELAASFSVIVSGDDVRRSKPAPDCYLLALKRLGVQACECIAIEDTQHGIEAATSAGIACYGIRNAMSEGHDFSRATHTFTSLGQARSWIAEKYGLVAH